MVTFDARLAATRAAFNNVAPFYDGPAGNNALVRRMRARLWHSVTDAVPVGSRLLDLGCGTGLDAVHLAGLGYRVVAIDASPRMVAMTTARAAAAGLSTAVTSIELDMHRLGALRGETFDGVYSDLGALNCALDLPAVAHACASLLRPGGHLIASVIGRWCPWEIAFYALHGDYRRAWRRHRSGVVPAPLNGGVVWTRYYTPRAFARAWAADFALVGYRALAVAAPPPYLIGLHDRHPALSGLLARLDDALGGLPLLRDAGDHFLMTLRRRGYGWGR